MALFVVFAFFVADAISAFGLIPPRTAGNRNYIPHSLRHALPLRNENPRPGQNLADPRAGIVLGSADHIVRGAGIVLGSADHTVRGARIVLGSADHTVRGAGSALILETALR